MFSYLILEMIKVVWLIYKLALSRSHIHTKTSVNYITSYLFYQLLIYFELKYLFAYFSSDYGIVY
jgi:hypothetical protein